MDSGSNVLHRIHVSSPGLVNWDQHHDHLTNLFNNYAKEVPYVGCQVLSEWESNEFMCGVEGHWPKMIKVVASPGYGVGSKIVLTFDRNTNEPDVSSDDLVRQLVAFSESIGNEIVGRWKSPRELEVTVVDDQGRSNYHEIGVTVSLHLRPRSENEREFQDLESMINSNGETLDINGEDRFRMGFQGEFFLALFITETGNPSAVSDKFIVSNCDSKVILNREIIKVASMKPVWYIDGPIVVHKSQLQIPQLDINSNPVMDSETPVEYGQWTLSFWISIVSIPKTCIPVKQEPSFRALLYHGPGKGYENGRRTPSLWLHPTENILTLRVSTENEMDYGVTASTPLMSDTWYHLALVIDNSTSSFRAAVYVDGEVLLELKHDQVIASFGSMKFGHDAWSSGPDSLVQNIRLYNSALSRFDLHKEILEMGSAVRQMSPSVVLPEADPDSCPVDPSMNALLFETPGQRDSAVANGDGVGLVARARTVGFGSKELLDRGVSQLHADSLYYHAMLSKIAVFFPDVREFPADENFLVQLQTAAMLGSIRAQLVLAHMLKDDCRRSTFYYGQVAREAFVENTMGGHESHIEMQILSDFVQEQGERGDEDEMIQYQMHQAQQGNVEAMLTLGQYYYWGSHGIERDQAQSFKYFKKAALLGSGVGHTACGNLLLKGEGVEQNVTKALEHYGLAVEQDNLEAMNGLGYIYYFGKAGVDQDVGKALEYFEKNLRDGDSYFNAAHIYMKEKPFRNIPRAILYLEIAATTYNNFAAAYQLGDYYFHNRLDSCSKAQKYFKQAALKASWGKVLRNGFDAFLDRDFEKAAIHYLEAAYLGYSRGAENAAWLLHSKLHTLIRSPFQQLFDLMGDSVLPLQKLLMGDLHQERGEELLAIKSWVSASTDGDMASQKVYRSQASYNLGMIAMKNRDWHRAEMYFRRAESFFNDDSESEQAKAVYTALKLAMWNLRALQTISHYSGPISSWIQDWWLGTGY